MRQKSKLNDILGYGLVTPVRRAASSDFVAAGGVTLIESCIRQIIKTRPGELPWKPEFGIDLERYRHRNPQASEVAATISGAIRAWEPRVSSAETDFVMPEPNVVVAVITWDVRSGAQAGSDVLIPPTATAVPL